MVETSPDLAFSEGNGGSADPPLRTTFDEDGSRDFYERIRVTGIQEHQLIGGLAVELASYSHDTDLFPRDTFEPQRVGGVALGLESFMRDMNEEHYN